MNNPRPQPQTTGRHAGSQGAPALRGLSVEGEALFLAALPVIDDITGQVCRRHRLSPSEADDFRSEVRLHFIDENYSVLRKFERRSSLPTYLTVVIQRVFLDYRNRLWGKWRPSAEARRLGPTAIEIERLVSRDGWSPAQAVETLRTNHGLVVDEALQALCDRLTRRGAKRQFVSEEQAAEVESAEPPPDTNVVRAEQGFYARRVRAALDRARLGLAAEERLILKMRFEDGVPVADIARALHLNQKRLYRTIERLLAQLGARLEADGISRSEVRELFADGGLAWSEDSEAGGGAPAPEQNERPRTPWLQQR